MKSPIVTKSEYYTQTGIGAHKDLRFDDAGLLFWNALTILSTLPDTTSRRDQTCVLASQLRKLGYEDLSLLAISEGIRLDEELKDHRSLIRDVIFYSNVNQSLGNIDEAKTTLEGVIKLCLERQDFGDAASASTNLAVMIANGGDSARATTLLTNSLKYLAKKPFPDTEFITHLTLIQLIGLHGGDPALAVKSGIALGKKFADRLTDQPRQMVIEPLRKAVVAYLKKNPKPNADAWKHENLAWVYSGASDAT